MDSGGDRDAMFGAFSARVIDLPSNPAPAAEARPEAAELASLIRAAATGDRAAFEQVYRTAAPRAFGVALRLLRRRDLAEEAVQEAFVEIWRKAASFDAARGQALAWIAGIVRYRAIDLLRRLQRRDGIETTDEAVEIADPAPLASDILIDGETAGRLAGCLALLRAEQQQAIRLAYFDGLTYEQVSNRLGAPIGTTKSRIRRGLQSLKRCLDREGSDV
jgi:RNA polymerase sigma-70 factor (ECF subfamily)